MAIKYAPSTNPPDDPGAFRQWLYRELLEISRAMSSGGYIQVVKAEPAKPYDGMVIAVDGTAWMPTAGIGAYVYLNGAWHMITSGPWVR